jgi:hypothetical protein
MIYRSMLLSNLRRKSGIFELITRNGVDTSISHLVEQVWPMVQDMGISKDIVYAAAELKVSNVS